MSGQRRRSVLVVDANATLVNTTVQLLATAGYEAAGVSSFADAKARLDSAPPDLLITSVRLGPYNGLHLIVRSGRELPTMATILTHDHDDPVLITEAACNNAAFLMRPFSTEALLGTVEASLSTRH